MRHPDLSPSLMSSRGGALYLMMAAAPKHQLEVSKTIVRGLRETGVLRLARKAEYRVTELGRIPRKTAHNHESPVNVHQRSGIAASGSPLS